MFASVDNRGYITQLVEQVAEPELFKYVDLPCDTVLRDSKGRLLYVVDDDSVRPRTAAELADDIVVDELPTPQERIDALEAAMLEMIMQMEG